jgi:tetratricopeptide (TPR) repeat protein
VPYGGHDKKEVWSAYLPHAIYVAGLVDVVDGAMSASLLERIGRCQESLGQYAPAETAHQKASSLRKEVLRREHPSTLTSMTNLAGVLGRQGKYEEAEAMNRQTLALFETVLGREHPSTLMSMSNLAAVLGRQGKYEEAEAMNRQTLALFETVLGREHPDTLTSMCNLALVLGCQGKYEEAEAMNRQTLALKETVLGREHPNLLTSHEPHWIACSPSTLDSSAGISTRKRSRLSRGLAKIGIRSSKHGSA